jgi:uncharacterized protein (DUF433 family)
MATQETDPLANDLISAMSNDVVLVSKNQDDLAQEALVEQSMARRIREAAFLMHESIEINKNKRGGVPVLKGTRIPVAQIIAELANNSSLSEIADDLDLDEDSIRCFLQEMANHLDRPFVK